MKVAILYGDGFEDVEALATRDVLVRAGINVFDLRIDNVINPLYVEASHKIHLTDFLDIKDFKGSDFDAIILPGGGLGVRNLLQSKEVDRFVLEAYKSDKLVCHYAGRRVLAERLGAYSRHDGKTICLPSWHFALSAYLQNRPYSHP